MSTVVILSSSPPQVFARPPTPGQCVSPLPSPSLVVRDAVDGLQRFKSAGKPGVRSLLTTRPGAENLPISILRPSPGKERFKPLATPSTSQHGRDGGSRFLKKTTLTTGLESAPSPIVLDATPCESSNHHPGYDHTQDWESLHLENAVPRRLDWTPVKQTLSRSDELPDPEGSDSELQADFLRAYSFTMEAQIERPAKGDGEGIPTKKRRLDFVLTTEPNPESPAAAARCNDLPKLGRKKQRTSGPKKALTITGLATSNYGEAPASPKHPPMLEYLGATQVGGNQDRLVTASSRKKNASGSTAVKKSRATKKAQPFSRLKSPTTALSALANQHVCFGSASQLVRDASPALQRVVPQPHKHMDVLSSDPVSPPRSQPVSLEPTSPQHVRGTSRFVKRRNLWHVAERDEDNALLHIDTIDLVDSPAVRLALAGKDVLLQPRGPEGPTTESARIDRPSAQHETPLIARSRTTIDINDVVTPGLPNRTQSHHFVRGFHTARISTRSSQQGTTATHDDQAPRPSANVSTEATTKSNSARPSFTGFSTHDLQKQIKAFGFKPVKKREAMIELLDRCWMDKHGPPETAVDAPVQTHGDFLSKVHDVTARPAPKVKKPRTQRNADASENPKSQKSARTKKGDGQADETPQKASKTPRKRATKKVTPECTVVDVNHVGLSKLGPELDMPETVLRGPAPSSKPQELKKPKNGTSRSGEVAATAAVSLPNAASSQNLAPGPGKLLPASAPKKKGPEPAIPEQDATQPDIQTQIRAAVFFQSRSAANHSVQSPTWHEKILMYDPIVLEDLALWLNTEGLRAIGEDREVGPIEVRTWCESEGVCCLWKGGGWRGNRME